MLPARPGATPPSAAHAAAGWSPAWARGPRPPAPRDQPWWCRSHVPAWKGGHGLEAYIYDPGHRQQPMMTAQIAPHCTVSAALSPRPVTTAPTARCTPPLATTLRRPPHPLIAAVLAVLPEPPASSALTHRCTPPPAETLLPPLLLVSAVRLPSRGRCDGRQRCFLRRCMCVCEWRLRHASNRGSRGAPTLRPLAVTLLLPEFVRGFRGRDAAAGATPDAETDVPPQTFVPLRAMLVHW